MADPGSEEVGDLANDDVQTSTSPKNDTVTQDKETNSATPERSDPSAPEPQDNDPTQQRISQAELERREREYREFVANLRGTGDPKALDRFTYKPAYRQACVRKSRYNVSRVDIPDQPPGNLQRLTRK